MFAGLAAHAILDLRAPLTASFGLTFVATAHTVGWPMAVGGSQRIADALVSYLRSLGGDVVLGHPVGSLGDPPPPRALLFHLTPPPLPALPGERLDAPYPAPVDGFPLRPGALNI